MEGQVRPPRMIEIIRERQGLEEGLQETLGRIEAAGVHRRASPAISHFLCHLNHFAVGSSNESLRSNMHIVLCQTTPYRGARNFE